MSRRSKPAICMFSTWPRVSNRLGAPAPLLLMGRKANDLSVAIGAGLTLLCYGPYQAGPKHVVILSMMDAGIKNAIGAN